MDKNSLFKSFIIHSIISFIITGSLLTFFVSKQIIKREIEHNVETVSLTLGHSLEHWFEKVDLNNLSTKNIDSLDEEFSSLHSLGNIIDIRIWRMDGSLAYSRDKSLINTLQLEKKHITQFNNNSSHYKLISTDKIKKGVLNNSSNEQIIIYLPIKEHGKNIGIFQVYRSFETSRKTINTGIRNVVTILSIGLLILYFFLAKTIYNSSNKLFRQKQEISTSYQKLNNMYKSMIQTITKAVDARDKYTSGHSQRVAEYTVDFAKYLALDDETIDHLEIAALLHDIGKLGVPESIINKPGNLTKKEFDLIKEHPNIGKKILEDINELEKILDAIKFHHERYDGTGYPTGIKGKQIPYIARIITITDAYDAMTSNRPYRNFLSHKKAINEIKKHVGTQFDPQLSKAFLEFIQTIPKNPTTE